MDHAINEATGKIESASNASIKSRYVCGFCKTKVALRSGKIRTPYFAHWRGFATTECVLYAQNLHGQLAHAQPSVLWEGQRIALRLLIPAGAERDKWSLELLLPSCPISQAKVTLDVGGRLQTLDMRGMENRRRVTAEPSFTPYGIVSFSGKPDPAFVANVEKECPGLPKKGPAVFSASGSGELRILPRVFEIRNAETYAFLWKEPVTPDFPQELDVENLLDRQGWSVAILTIPEAPSQHCTDWLRVFTGLQMVSEIPSISPVWPFLFRYPNAHTIECVKSDLVLMSAKMIPLGARDSGPTILAQNDSLSLSATGFNRTPAFFALTPGETSIARVAAVDVPQTEIFISIAPMANLPQTRPSVDLTFVVADGSRVVVPLHKKDCKKVAMAARLLEQGPDSLSMPLGTTGVLRIEGPSGRSKVKIFAGDEAPTHNPHMRLAPKVLLETISSAFADPACELELDFGGFGCLRLSTMARDVGATGEQKLPFALRSRLLSFMLQIRPTGPIAESIKDAELVEALAAIAPESQFIPHYRALVKDVLACSSEHQHFWRRTSL